MAYHEWIYRGMRGIDAHAGQGQQKFLELWNQMIKEPLQKKPEMLLALYWELISRDNPAKGEGKNFIRGYYYEIFDGGNYYSSDKKRLWLSEKDDELKGVASHPFHEGRIIESWPADVTLYVTGEHPQDYLTSRMGWVVVSDKVKRVFEDCHISGVQFLPVRVLHEKKNKEFGPFWALNAYQKADGLNWEHTRWSIENPAEVAYPELGILIPAFNFEVVQNLDVFRLDINGEGSMSIFISQKVRECLERARAMSGFELKPVKAY